MGLSYGNLKIRAVDAERECERLRGEVDRLRVECERLRVECERLRGLWDEARERLADLRMAWDER